jgi:hypothetical protein
MNNERERKNNPNPPQYNHTKTNPIKKQPQQKHTSCKANTSYKHYACCKKITPSPTSAEKHSIPLSMDIAKIL